MTIAKVVTKVQFRVTKTAASKQDTQSGVESQAEIEFPDKFWRIGNIVLAATQAAYLKRKGKLERRKLRQRLGCVAGDGGGGAVVVKPDGQWRDGAVVDRKTVEAAGEKAVTRWGGERSLAVEVEEFLMEWVVRSMARKLQR
nr:hypothetical protein Iba_chr02cCG4020 [Ipomoea batatas]